jgi:hypothetical protein
MSIKKALRQRRKEQFEVAGPAAQRQRLPAFLQNRVWPSLPKDASRRWTRKQEERFLGYGKHGEPV